MYLPAFVNILLNDNKSVKLMCHYINAGMQRSYNTQEMQTKYVNDKKGVQKLQIKFFKAKILMQNRIYFSSYCNLKFVKL